MDIHMQNSARPCHTANITWNVRVHCRKRMCITVKKSSYNSTPYSTNQNRELLGAGEMIMQLGSLTESQGSDTCTHRTRWASYIGLALKGKKIGLLELAGFQPSQENASLRFIEKPCFRGIDRRTQHSFGSYMCKQKCAHPHISFTHWFTAFFIVFLRQCFSV